MVQNCNNNWVSVPRITFGGRGGKYQNRTYCIDAGGIPYGKVYRFW